MSLLGNKCVPCNEGVKTLSDIEIQDYLKETPGWEVIDSGKSIKKNYKFKNFAQALQFSNKIGQIAEEENHHPDIMLGWGYCSINLTTHSIEGLHENDFIMAAKINRI